MTVPVPAAIGSTAFGALAWGSIVLVGVIFTYEIAAVLRELRS